MAVAARFLIDTSAAARMRTPIVANKLSALVNAGLVGTTAVLDAEALHAARSPGEYEQLRIARHSAYEYLPTNDHHWRSALDAQRQLAAIGELHKVGYADLLTAVIAAEHDLTVVHYDAGFDTAATVLDFKHEWVAPKGQIP
ncbi:PIN domain-containing protein [Mycobacteroides abscessus]|uniref:Ribonuclease VapC n=1 Tax=Mycobacteroides abscessus TaxID=36809 RepID=A0A0U0ZT14_9MYCO|nr:PIN domain-containing protein [Mycobacteroides abscessus]CPV66645.1 Conserved protein of uncharacterised function with PIN domain [Mycobacteroides abscessus]